MNYQISNTNYKKANFQKCFHIMQDSIYELLSELDLSTVDRLMYLVLYRHADTETGLCYPSRKTLAKLTGLKTEKAVTTSIKRLMAVGLVELVAKGGFDKETGANLSNTYRIKYIYPKDWLISEYV